MWVKLTKILSSKNNLLMGKDGNVNDGMGRIDYWTNSSLTRL